MSLLEFQNVSFESDNKSILKNISVDIEEGDFFSIVGPSGSGKSTFLKLCSHLISPIKGTISYKNKNIFDYNPTELRKNIVYCFQSPYLFGDTVIENINFPFTIRNIKPNQKRIDELFSMFHMDGDYLHKDIINLSGGEKQRISLIRSLLFMPEILLLDEITSALDVDNAVIVENVISALNNNGTTVLWITHNLEQSRKYANKLLLIESGEIKSLEVLK
ncbi:ABC transporter ATP-binding protein [Anaerocolumna chitinilytica]|uniref:ABC transporter ATP-binding protein n=1 Tax=Anaerocolumna chitinilytica TaxID=1727145 RepID=A0A7I8DQB9_9FIRM|nr:ATP-binding cassette domain-containing protein [Anaerocolumna chitinilytica]BCJ98476.1 ABC transporter ATP-binding protein [Anaerocolumna chitinilytica]